MPFKLTIFRKGLILLAVPLLFQLVLIIVVAQMQRQTAEATLLLVLVVAALASVLITLVLAFTFYRSVGSRLSLLADNAARLSEGRDLADPVAGRDEISEVDQVFRAMAQALRLQANIVESIPIGLLILRLDNPQDARSLRLVEANPSASMLLGTNVDVLLGKTLLEAFPNNSPEILEAYANVARTGQPAEIGEIYYGDELVQENHWSVKAFPLPDAQVGLAFENISARKQAEAIIQQLNRDLEARVEQRTLQLQDANHALENRIAEHQLAEVKFRGLLEAAPDAVVIIDSLGQIVLVNAQTERVFGYGRDELLGSPVEMLMPEHLRVPHVADRAGYLRDPSMRRMGVGRELAGLRKDGVEIPVEITLSPLRTPDGVLAMSVIRDITERKQAEERFRESEERFRLIVEGVQDYAIIMLDPTGHVATWNAGAERLRGYREEEIVGQHFSRFYPPEDVAKGLPDTELKTVSRWGRLATEGWRVRKDGTRFLAKVVLTSIRDKTGRLRGFSQITQDITERKRAEERIQTQLARLHLINQITQAIAERHDLQSIYRVVLAQLEENLPVDFDAICIWNAQSKTLQVVAVGPKSQPLNDQMGLHEHAVFPVDTNGLGACVRGETIYDPDLTEVNALIPQTLARVGLRSLAAAPLGIGGKTFGILLTARFKPHAYTSGDCEFLKQLSSHVFLAGQHAQLYQDLKDAYDTLRRSQQAVVQQERLRALGQMASGIAHDINNAISPISIYADALLEGERNLTPRAREYLTTIAQAIDDVARTVSRMRDFYRQQEKQVELSSVNLNTLVQQVLDLTRARWRDQSQARGITVRVQTDLSPDLPPVLGVESELRDAMTNLVFNAVDAMPMGGTLTFRTCARGQVGTETPTHAVVEVSDTGTGMDEMTRQRCLEPFFTTKGERGTGLGLPMVYGAMQRHSGEVEIESEPGLGTKVRLVFGLPHNGVHMDVQSEQEVVAPPSLRILVVDDDPVLRKAVQDTLEADGHRISTADGGQAGINAFRAARSRGEPFEIIITDLGMPYIDGRAVAKAVKEEAPTTGVLLLTGWGQRMKDEGDIPMHIDRVLSKPPRIKDLREALAALAAGIRSPDPIS